MKNLKKALDSGLSVLAVGTHNFSGHYASGSITSASYSVKVLSGACDITSGPSDGEETWSAGHASGGSVEKIVNVTDTTNCVLRARQYSNGKESEGYYIAGDGGAEYQHFLAQSAALQHLLSDGITLTNVSIEECLALPVDWTKICNNPCETSDWGHGYVSGGPEYEIVKCDQYVTVTVTTTRNSCVQMRGWYNSTVCAQWLLDGTDNLKAYRQWAFRERVRQFTVGHPTLTRAQAVAWLRAKVQWKNEHTPEAVFSIATNYPFKETWAEIAAATSREGNRISTMRFDFPWYTGETSVPRASAHAKLISELI